MNYKNEFINGGILAWVNSVRTGKRLKYNPYIQHNLRGGRFRPGGKTNRQLWREASKILLAEYQYWAEKLESNRELIQSGRGYLVEYPKIGNLPFRSNDTFLGGEWSHFSGFWESFIEQLKLVFSSLIPKKYKLIKVINKNFSVKIPIALKRQRSVRV